MFVHRHGVRVRTNIRDGIPAEVERESAKIPHHLHYGWIVQHRAFRYRNAERRGERRIVVQKRLRDFIHHKRIEQRLVPLDVQYDIALVLLRRLGDPARPVGVIGRGEHRLTAERADLFEDPFVVCGHDKTVEQRRKRGAFVDSPDERLPAYIRQRFAGKARRGVAGGDHAENVHGLATVSTFPNGAAEMPHFRARARIFSRSTGCTSRTIHSRIAFPSGVCWA